jgi:hypothetical protein
MSATPWMLGAFALVAAPILFRAWLRRGHNLLDRLPLAPGETVQAEHDIELSSMPRQRALVMTLAFMRARARITSSRVVLAQPGLSTSPTLVVRFVVHRTGSFESTWADGFGTFAVDAARSGMAERDGIAEVRIAAADDSPVLPSYVVVRGPGMQAVAEALGVAERKASV